VQLREELLTGIRFADAGRELGEVRLEMLADLLNELRFVLRLQSLGREPSADSGAPVRHSGLQRLG
jgi:hypothetical protein